MMMPRTRDNYASAGSAAALVIAAGAIVLLATGCSHKSADDYLLAGDQAMQATRLADAENDYQSAIKTAPNDPRPHVALGNLYLFEQKPGPAEIEFMKVLELDAKNAPAHAALGNLYSSQGQPGLSEAQYRAAVALDSAKASYRLSLGTMLQKEGKHGEAEAEFRTAVGLEPKNAHAHLALANLFNTEPNRQAEAQAEYAQVKALDPSLMPGTATAASSPASAAPAGAPTVVASAPSATPKIRDLNRKFKLTHDSPVYQTPDQSTRVVAQVHRGKYVRVTGITGNWFRIELRNGTVGFIPVTAAE
jgi:tetratricopeptide (TPR) repeat protein